MQDGIVGDPQPFVKLGLGLGGQIVKFIILLQVGQIRKDIRSRFRFGDFGMVGFIIGRFSRQLLATILQPGGVSAFLITGQVAGAKFRQITQL